ncbi:mitochondrion protein [Phaffia rhodozyma]|uniref:Succinate dehydrogenase assembly factor 2, mitochondrial n=1 Tax=Phaffia rhodozyma TaxID=264483 RepID=A0A0F7SSN9_PHARH|nr:mitochondrion protein [Phaffia rhodozyma]
MSFRVPSLVARTLLRARTNQTNSGLPAIARSASSSSPIPPIQDPYPLPFSPSLHNTPPGEINSEENSFQIPPLDRSHEDIETTRKRLIYQTRKRGMLEGDLLLATFARDRLEGMSPELVKEFDELLDEADWDIYYWCTNRKTPPAKWAKSQLLEDLRVHTKNEGKVVRSMPDLDALPKIKSSE